MFESASPIVALLVIHLLHFGIESEVVKCCTLLRAHADMESLAESLPTLQGLLHAQVESLPTLLALLRDQVRTLLALLRAHVDPLRLVQQLH